MQRKNRSTNGPSADDPPFSHLPPYKAPNTGLLSYVPRLVLPYAELARIDKPGFALLWIVHTIGIVQAGIIMKTPLSELLHMVIFFLPACWVLMCVNFAWNDTCDFSYDAKVARTRHRPLVRGDVSPLAAITFDCALAAILAAFLIPLPRTCAVYAIPMALGCFIYPLSKRWSNYPQIVFGVVLPCGVFMGAAAVGATPLPYPSRLSTVLDLKTWTVPHRRHAFALISNYLTNVIWTILFEVIYSFQDVQWDEGAGIGTMTVLLRRRGIAKPFLFLLALIQLILHAQTGRLTDAHSPFWPLSVAFASTSLTIQILCVDLNDEESCMFWFAAGQFTGLAMLLGYAGEYYIQQLNFH